MSHSSIRSSPPRVMIKGTVSWDQTSRPLSILLDSGADNNFIDTSFATQIHIPCQLLPHPKEVFALDGRLLAQVTHRTVPVSLMTGMSKVRPGGQSRPAVRFHTARSFGLITYYLWPACTVKQNK